MSRPEEAKYLVEHPILKRLFDDLEHSAIARAINAPLTDDATRAANLAEARAIQSVRRQLGLAAQGLITLADDTGA